MSSSSVYVPYILVPKSSLPSPPVDPSAASDADRQVFTALDHLIGARRRWGGINGQLIPKDESGRILGMGAAGMAKEEIIVRKFMESCAFKAMLSCAGGVVV